MGWQPILDFQGPALIPMQYETFYMISHNPFLGGLSL